MYIINYINEWMIGIKNSDEFKTVVVCINSSQNPVLHMRAHKNWIPYIFSRNNLLYQEMKYSWADRYYVRIPCSFGPDTHLVEQNKV